MNQRQFSTRQETATSSFDSDNSDAFRIETLKFLRENCTLIEASEPSNNFFYVGSHFTNNKSFSITIVNVLKNLGASSLILGFTTCARQSILDTYTTHLTEQCIPTGCGGQSQQFKIFNCDDIGKKITIERQDNGEIYFTINNSFPIRINFDDSSSSINLPSQETLTPYIQLSGNILACKLANESMGLNIEAAIARRQFGTATAYGPRSSPTTSFQRAHQAFVASSSTNIKFVELKYPINDVKLSDNRMAVLRKNECGERSVFFIEKNLKINNEVVLHVTKLYYAQRYANGFEFGITSKSFNEIKNNERDFVVDSRFRELYGPCCVMINRDIKIDDKFTFTRLIDGSINIMKNNVFERKFKTAVRLREYENLSPFIILNGTASGILISSSSSDMTIKFSEMYEWPPIDFKTTDNVTVTNRNLLTRRPPTGPDGVIVNLKSFDKVLTFIIREIQPSEKAQSLTFGLTNSAKIGSKTPREISSILDFVREDIIQSPALGMKFSLYKTSYGKVTLKNDDGRSRPLTLFLVDAAQFFYPVFILNGSVVAMELLPSPKKKIVRKLPAQPQQQQQQPQPQPQQQPQSSGCNICFDISINSVFVPCGHRFACHDCAKICMRNDQKCPVCRHEITDLLKTFD